jgi:hypothetical protein
MNSLPLRLQMAASPDAAVQSETTTVAARMKWLRIMVGLLLVLGAPVRLATALQRLCHRPMECVPM